MLGPDFCQEKLVGMVQNKFPLLCIPVGVEVLKRSVIMWFEVYEIHRYLY